MPTPNIRQATFGDTTKGSGSLFVKGSGSLFVGARPATPGWSTAIDPPSIGGSGGTDFRAGEIRSGGETHQPSVTDRRGFVSAALGASREEALATRTSSARESWDEDSPWRMSAQDCDWVFGFKKLHRRPSKAAW